MNNSIYNYCLIGGASDVGQVRKANEDRGLWFDSPNGRVGLVCDGMGGHVGGQIASQTAIDAIQEFLANNLFDDPKEAISSSITYANQAVLNKAEIQPELSGMGSTCVMLLIRDGKVFYGHVGDSRIYIISSRIIRQLTKDHSFVQMLVDAGKLRKEEAERHPRKNEITNALGIPNMQSPTVSNTPIEPEAGSCFLLCSDGLTGMVDDKKIEKIVSNRSLTLNQRAKELIDLANEAGGVDNITVQLVEFALGASDIQHEKPKRPKSVWIYITIISLILLCVVVVYIFFIPKSISPNSNQIIFQKTELIKNKELKTINIVDSIQFIKNKEVAKASTGIDKKYRIDKDSVYIEDGNGEFISISYVTSDNQIAFKWADKPFGGEQIKIRIETDSVSFLISYKIKKIETKISDTNKKEVNKEDVKTSPKLSPPVIDPVSTKNRSKKENIKMSEKKKASDD